MTAHATPPAVADRIRALEVQVENLSRAQNPVKPNLFDIADVSGMPAASGQTLEYNRTTGRWEPGEQFAIGDVKWTASPNASGGRWLFADGSAVSRTTYDELFAVIGTTYGPGNGSTTFNLPNLGGRFVIGVSPDALGATGGSRNSIPITHTHTTGLHGSGTEAAGFGLTASSSFQDRVRVDGSGDSTGSAGSSGTNANLPPYIALWGLIRY